MNPPAAPTSLLPSTKVDVVSSRREASGGAVVALDTFTPVDLRPTATLVLLHGGGQSRQQWHEVGTGLAAAGLRAVTMDLRGHGESEWPGSYRHEDYVADLERALDDLVGDLAGPIILVGHSHGGKVVLSAAPRRKAAVAGVVLVDSVPDMEPDWSVHDFYKSTAAGFDDLDEAAQALSGLVGKQMTPGGVERGLQRGDDGRWYWTFDTRVLDAVVDGLEGDIADMYDAARRLEVPVLLMRTEESEFLDDENVARLRAAVPQLSVLTLPGTQHHRPWGRPELVVEHLRDFVPVTRRATAAAELLRDVETVGPLFEPFRLGDFELASRLAMAPMTRNFCPGGVPGPDVVDYYGRRAAGGVGLIISEGIYVPHPSAGTYPDVPEWGVPGAVEAWRRVTDRVHAEGGRMLAQLWHVGAVRRSGKPPVPDAPVVSPSGLDLRGREVGAPLTAEEIDAIVASYASAATDAMAAGFDGVEIHGAHGYLLDEFHWDRTNLREDRFGGSLRERSTLGALVTAAVREAIGPAAPLSYRFSQWKLSDYTAVSASDPDELAEMLEPIVAAGASVLHASTRRYWTPAFEGSDRTLAGWARRLTGLPVIAVGSIGVAAPFRSEPDPALDGVSLAPLVDLVTAGEVDLVAVGRALVSDPEWAAKVRDRRPEEIRWYRKEHEAVLH